MGRLNRSKIDIKRALLEILEYKRLDNTSVTEISKLANVSRSTFYAHYQSPIEVYEEIVSDIADLLSEKSENGHSNAKQTTGHLSQKDSKQLNGDIKTSKAGLFGKPKPKLVGSKVSAECMRFCDFLANPGKYAAVIKESRFIETLLANRNLMRKSPLIGTLMDSGLDFQQAYALFVFQMSGCFLSWQTLGVSDRDWPKLIGTISAFIDAGASGAATISRRAALIAAQSLQDKVSPSARAN